MIIKRKYYSVGANGVQSVDAKGDFSSKFQKLLGIEPADPRKNTLRIKPKTNQK
jgi:hypothetical protein